MGAHVRMLSLSRESVGKLPFWVIPHRFRFRFRFRFLLSVLPLSTPPAYRVHIYEGQIFIVVIELFVDVLQVNIFFVETFRFVLPQFESILYEHALAGACILLDCHGEKKKGANG